MTKEEFNQKMQEITDNLTDQGKVTASLTELYNGFEQVFDSNTNLTSENEKLKDDNKKLQDYNMDLFRQVGKQNKEIEDENNKKFNKGEEDDETPKLKYEDLFNEKGEFK